MGGHGVAQTAKSMILLKLSLILMNFGSPGVLPEGWALRDGGGFVSPEGWGFRDGGGFVTPYNSTIPFEL